MGASPGWLHPMDFTLTEHFPTGLDRLWVVFGRPEYPRRKYRALGAKAVRLQRFEVTDRNCIFINTSTNWAVSLTDCMSITSVQTHYIALRGNCQLVGITGWADTATRIYQNMPAPHNTGGTNVAPTT